MQQKITTCSIYNGANNEHKYSLLGARRLKLIRAQKSIEIFQYVSVSALVQPPQVMLVAFIAELGTYLKSYSTQYKSCLLGDITGFVTKRNNQNEKKGQVRQQ